MTGDSRPVLSVIVRRFRPEVRDDIRASLARLQQAAHDQPGYLGEQNSLSDGAGTCELVTVFAFDSRRNLERWEASALRARFLAELDRHPQESPKRTRFDDLALLLHPGARIRKIEIVAILVFWIVVLGTLLDYLAAMILPGTLPPMARKVLLISVNVLLISYVFLPRTSRALTWLKTWLKTQLKAWIARLRRGRGR